MVYPNNTPNIFNDIYLKDLFKYMIHLKYL